MFAIKRVVTVSHKCVAKPFLIARFSTSPITASNIGSTPIVIPQGVELAIQNKDLDVVTLSRMELARNRQGRKKAVNLTQEALISGPKGSIIVDLAEFVKVEQENGKAKVSVQKSALKYQNQMWGTTRSLINNGIVGVSEGHIAIIKFVGTGYRAILDKDEKGQFLSLRVGYCVPMVVRIPEDLNVKVPVPHRVIVEGIDRQKVKALAARVRSFRKPEPYKGKGIFVDNETIKLKQRKIK
jgi:large subunit ribosomal protein L6